MAKGDPSSEWGAFMYDEDERKHILNVLGLLWMGERSGGSFEFRLENEAEIATLIQRLDPELAARYRIGEASADLRAYANAHINDQNAHRDNPRFPHLTPLPEEPGALLMAFLRALFDDAETRAATLYNANGGDDAQVWLSPELVRRAHAMWNSATAGKRFREAEEAFRAGTIDTAVFKAVIREVAPYKDDQFVEAVLRYSEGEIGELAMSHYFTERRRAAAAD